MRLIILGAGGFGRTIGDVAEQMHRYREIIYLDDHSGREEVQGSCGDFLKFRREDTAFFPAFGDNEIRLQWLDKLAASECPVASIIHPSAYCSPKAIIEEGVAILPGAIVNTEVRVCRGALINLGAIIDHGTTVGVCTHVCVGAIIKAENRIPDLSKIEAGSVVEARTLPFF